MTDCPNCTQLLAKIEAYQRNRLVCERCGFSGAMVDNQTPGEMMAEHFAICPDNAMAAELKGLREQGPQCH